MIMNKERCREILVETAKLSPAHDLILLAECLCDIGRRLDDEVRNN